MTVDIKQRISYIHVRRDSEPSGRSTIRQQSLEEKGRNSKYNTCCLKSLCLRGKSRTELKAVIGKKQ